MYKKTQIINVKKYSIRYGSNMSIYYGVFYIINILSWKLLEFSVGWFIGNVICKYLIFLYRQRQLRQQELRQVDTIQETSIIINPIQGALL